MLEPEAARRQMEEKLRTVDYEFQTDWGRAWAKGEAEGEAKGEAKALLRVLAARDIKVDETDRDRILTCTDTATLDAWLDRAIVATTVEEIFG